MPTGNRARHTVDHARVEALLREGGLSFREIARQAACSDFSVRKIARGRNGDNRPMRDPAAHAPPVKSRGRRRLSPLADDALPPHHWKIMTGFGVAAIGLAIFAYRSTMRFTG